MKWRMILTYFTAAMIAAWLAAGCGGGGSTNTVTVTVTSSIGNNIIVGQSTTLNAQVTGGTTTNIAVNWQPCQFTTTTVSGTTTTTSTAAACPADGSLGTLSNQQTTGTATFTATDRASPLFPKLVIPNLSSLDAVTIELVVQAAAYPGIRPGTTHLAT